MWQEVRDSSSAVVGTLPEMPTFVVEVNYNGRILFQCSNCQQRYNVRKFCKKYVKIDQCITVVNVNEAALFVENAVTH